VEVLRVLTEMVRQGTFTAASNCPTTHLPPFDKVVHVGHSFGSAITLALLATYGNLSSAAISTGFIIAEHPNQDSSTTFGFEYAATNNPCLWGSYGSGYIVPATVSNLQTTFFHRDNASDLTGFSDRMLAYADSIKQPLTVAEWVSIRGLLNIGKAPDFTGSLQFFLAEYDFLICDGDCVDNYDSAFVEGLYPNATDVDIYVQPGAGHGLTLHRNASAGYAVMLDWLEKNGL
jgi:pimeloyl-ACP methyl ester carboxylesterase